MAIPPLTRLLTRAAKPAAGAHVALTFDDGPHPIGTPAVLEILVHSGVVATFFLVAEQAERHPRVVAQLVAGGHEVALHGYRHLLLQADRPSR